jgi:hypothetical protein
MKYRTVEVLRSQSPEGDGNFEQKERCNAKRDVRDDVQPSRNAWAFGGSAAIVQESVAQVGEDAAGI